MSEKHWAEPCLQTFNQIRKYNSQGTALSKIVEANKRFKKQSSAEGLTMSSPTEEIAIQSPGVGSTM